MTLTRQIEAARVAREREGERNLAQMQALKDADDALMAEGRLDMMIAMYLHARECHENLMVLGIAVLRRLAQHAIDAHCTARAAGERSVYDRADLEKYIEADRLDPMSEIRILTRRLLPSEALTVLLSLLPPENE